MLTDRLKHRDNVGVASAGFDGAAINEDGRAVETRHADQATGHVLVTTTHSNEAVEAFAADHGFDRIGDDLPRHQRILHTLGAVGDTIRHGDGIEDHRLAASGIGAFLGFFRKFVDVHIAGGDIGPG